ncbi:MAG: hypothetical protein CMM06_03930 [Rhodopirellula sp.]|nr:hypothetical protein [Rhodopirellula sp.]|tara:strand:+ start:13895 stop:15265 length:1371 start_codon:yes stop_codon:yes gene_type:complete
MVDTTRRRFLQSTVSAGGLGLSLDGILQAQASDASVDNDTAVIQVWLGGGPSQFETFDPKPEAPIEIRGPYGTIPTLHSGVKFCETMPLTSQVVDRAAIIRSISHGENGHFVAAHWLSTGYRGMNNQASHPSAGALVSKFLGPRSPGMPPYVLLSEEQTRNPNIGEVMGPGHLGSGHGAFTVLQDPYVSGYRHDMLQAATSNLKLADDVTIDRVGDRRSLLTSLDNLSRNIDASRTMRGIDRFGQVALDMVTNGKARKAFDLSDEPAHIHKLYGGHRWGQSALLARRLVEAGVSFVTINTAPDSLCWDWHLNIVNDNRPADGSLGPSRGMDLSGPPLDQMIAALVTDIYQRGLDKKVMLLVWGEFGRTPRINKTGGRDHWGPLMSILLAGGGIKVGQVIGQSNSRGETPVDRPIHPNDVLATVYRHLGIDLSSHTVTREGRPIPLLPNGEPISELI